MSEAFRKFVKRDPPPAALIRFRCAKLHKATVSNSDSSVQEYNTIYDVLRGRGWKEHDTDSNDWNIFWADKDWIHDTFDRIHLDPHQRINHFRNHYELTRKDLLIKNMKRMKRYFEREGRPDEAEKYNVCPITFVVPQEYNMFVEEFKKHSGATWIMKPIGKSQGAGIFLVNRLAQLQAWRPPTTWAPGFERDRKKDKDKDKDQDDDVEGTGNGAPEPFVVQKYVDGPLLVGGKKFDIRLYAMVTSYQPLTIYMHRGGFCRFSMSRYTSDKSDMTNLGKHLTNVAVQKHSGKAAYKRTGAKWDVSRLKSYIISTAGLDITNRLLSDIESIVINSLLAVQKVMINDKHCFEVYGYDILIDSNYHPWLLEVNASPSLTANTTADYEFKYGMLDDALAIIDLEKYLSGNELQVGGFDLLYRDGQRYSPPESSEIRSYLGCANNRLAQLKKLAKTRAWESREGKRGDASEESRSDAAAGKFARTVRPYPAAAPASNVNEATSRQTTREKRGFNRGQTMAATATSSEPESSHRVLRHSQTVDYKGDLDTT